MASKLPTTITLILTFIYKCACLPRYLIVFLTLAAVFRRESILLEHPVICANDIRDTRRCSPKAIDGTFVRWLRSPICKSPTVYRKCMLYRCDGNSLPPSR
ncbi:hypothetical protein GGR51DRAFT_496235 [Nemania sp. FL0031]|nr:hypothetical protein GGR51DRAFT_496235 [Nemania sp. FL0031]